MVKVECQERSIPSTKILVDSKIQWNIEELKIHVRTTLSLGVVDLRRSGGPT